MLAMSLTESRVADLHGFESTIVKVYPLLLVVAESLRVEVTVKTFEEPWVSEVSVEETVTVRPEIVSQATEGETVRFSV